MCHGQLGLSREGGSKRAGCAHAGNGTRECARGTLDSLASLGVRTPGARGMEAVGVGLRPSRFWGRPYVSLGSSGVSLGQVLLGVEGVTLAAYFWTSGTVTSLPFLFVYLTLVFGMTLSSS